MQIKRGRDESPHAFLLRVIKIYFENIGTTPKTIGKSRQHEQTRIPLTSTWHFFLKGYNNAKVVREMKLRRETIQLGKPADVAKKSNKESKKSMMFLLLASVSHNFRVGYYGVSITCWGNANLAARQVARQPQRLQDLLPLPFQEFTLPTYSAKLSALDRDIDSF